MNLEDRREILRRLAPGNLIQPATALWRVYEIEAIFRHVHFAGRVLDLGCGDGSLARVVFSRCADPCVLVGVEPDPRDAADARLSKMYQDVHVAMGDAIPVPDASFDLVFSNSVLEHIPRVDRVLAEAARLLKSGGLFIFTVPSEQFHTCLAGSRWLGYLARRRGETSAQALDRRVRHLRYWSPEEWNLALGEAGFELCTTHRYFPRPAVRAWERLSNWTGGLAFELFQSKSETRSLQRGLRLDWVDGLVPPRVREWCLERMLASSLNEPDPLPGEPSGGLLVVARKPGC